MRSAKIGSSGIACGGNDDHRVGGEVCRMTAAPRLGHCCGVRRCKDVGGRACQLVANSEEPAKAKLTLTPGLPALNCFTDLSERRLQRGSREHHDRPGTASAIHMTMGEFDPHATRPGTSIADTRPADSPIQRTGQTYETPDRLRVAGAEFPSNSYRPVTSTGATPSRRRDSPRQMVQGHQR